MNKIILTLGAASLLVSTASAVSLVNESFSYADGNLVGQGGWTAHSGAGNKAIQVSGGAISLDQSSGSGEDVNTAFAAIGAGEIIYAGFDFTLASGQTVDPDANGLYFAHFKDSGFGFRARVFVTVAGSGGDFSVGLDGDGSAPSVTWASDLSFDTTYRAVVSYDFDTGNTQLWIDATAEGDTNISDNAGSANTAIEAFAFRQASDYTGSQLIDNLLVATTFSEAAVVPEPSSTALLGLAGLATLLRRKR